MHKFGKQLVLLLVGVAIGSGLLVGNYFYEQKQAATTFIQREHRPATEIGGLTPQQKQQLASHTYQSGEGVVMYVNHGRSTLNLKSWQKNQVIYG